MQSTAGVAPSIDKSTRRSASTRATASRAVVDQVLEERLADYTSSPRGSACMRTACSDVGAHDVCFDGLRLYAARVRASLTREDLEDRLLDDGVNVTVRAIALWERDERHPPSPAALLALPRLLGCRLGDLLLCWECAERELGVLGEEATVRQTKFVLDVVLLIARREELGLSRAAAAARAHITPRQAELVERGKVNVLELTVFTRYLDGLGLPNLPYDMYLREEVVPASASAADSLPSPTGATS